ncbi:protein LEAD-SENSITIVE 1-like isoform X1 [Musa acuminata AAA Group]|uniref:protein LEAD-SENSITIVE 1-like isoform X1 n=1 Tax=Musa acuminata AAA Group TaxID=214697 RepID=UPI0031E04F06
MGLLSNRVERTEIKAGDHIYSWRAAYTYSHHVQVCAGIYVGGSKVVHFTRKKDTSDGINSSSSSSLSSGVPSVCPTFPDCGFHQSNSGVILSCLDCFLGNGSLYCFEYGVPPSVFLAKVRGGTCTTAESDPPETVINRAMYLLQNGFGNYDVFENNCEDFALYCKTGLLSLEELGIGRSGQASSFFGVPLAALFSTPFKLLAAGPVGMATVTAGMYCAGRYITDIGVRKDVVKVAVEDLTANLGWRRCPKERAPGKDCDALASVASIEEEKRQHL